MASVREMLRNAKLLDVQASGLKKTRDRLVDEAQEQCRHPVDSLREAPHKKWSTGACFRPFRICIDCGLKELGWGCGHRELGRGVYSGIAELSRDEADKRVISGSRIVGVC